MSTARACFKCASVSQELAKELKNGLQRPGCMDECSFVQPDTQCPKKPRGRKKKGTKTDTATVAEPTEVKGQTTTSAEHDEVKPRKRRGKTASSTEEQLPTSSRPSAAACGFSTVGMSDGEVDKKIREARIQENEVEPKKPRGKKACGTEQQQQQQPGSASSNQVSNVNKGRKRQRGVLNGKHMNSSDAAPSDETQVPPGKLAKLSKPANAAGSEDVTTTKRKRTRASKAGQGQEVATTRPTRPTRKKARKTETADTAMAEVSETTAASTSTGSEVPPSTADAAASRKAEAKKKLSRKSGAYHKAAAAAKRNGATKEEQKAAGKAVSRIRYLFFVCLRGLHSNAFMQL